MELENVRWDNHQKTLTGSIVRPEGSRGKIYIYVPAGYAFKNQSIDGGIGRGMSILSSGVMFLDIEMKKRKADFLIKF